MAHKHKASRSEYWS